MPTTRGRVLARIVGALEAAGVEFLAPSRASPGCGEGVRLRRQVADGAARTAAHLQPVSQNR